MSNVGVNKLFLQLSKSSKYLYRHSVLNLIETCRQYSVIKNLSVVIQFHAYCDNKASYITYKCTCTIFFVLNNPNYIAIRSFLQEQLAMSQATTIEVLCNVEKLEQNLREYAERPITNWSEDCECRPEVAEIANGLKETIKKHRQADNLQIGGLSSAPSCKRLSHAVPSATSSPRHARSFDAGTQTTFESHNRQSNG